ncbi:hypothetical protein ykris0001_28740 [Yersinia kristensenii ATCC 33638]|nr:hypothetical protein ykris0001_28740 [Yersinia kristensenii ATCC 33638]
MISDFIAWLSLYIHEETSHYLMDIKRLYRTILVQFYLRIATPKNTKRNLLVSHFLYYKQ